MEATDRPLMNSIQTLWPDMQITSLKNLTPQTVIKLLERIQDDYKAKIELVSEQPDVDNVDHLDFKPDSNLILLKNVHFILNEIGLEKNSNIKVNDLHMTNQRRFEGFLKVAIHFLQWLDIYIDEMVAISQKGRVAISESISMRYDVEQLLQSIAELTEALGATDNERDADLRDLQAEYAKVLELKEERRVASTAKAAKLEALRAEVQYKKFRLQSSNAKLLSMRKKVVSEKEFERLLKTKQILMDKLRSLTEILENENLNTKYKILDMLDSTLSSLKNVNFDSLTQLMDGCKQSTKHVKDCQQKEDSLNTKLHLHKSSIKSLETTIQTINLAIESIENKILEKRNQMESYETDVNQEKHNLAVIRAQKDEYGLSLDKDLKYIESQLSLVEDDLQRILSIVV